MHEAQSLILIRTERGNLQPNAIFCYLSRSRHDGQGYVITAHRYFWMQLLVRVLDTCFWYTSHQLWRPQTNVKLPPNRIIISRVSWDCSLDISDHTYKTNFGVYIVHVRPIVITISTWTHGKQLHRSSNRFICTVIVTYYSINTTTLHGSMSILTYSTIGMPIHFFNYLQVIIQ